MKYLLLLRGAGDGWYDIIDRLCSHLQFITDKNNYPQVEATQVKEKFGGLRFYYVNVVGEDTNKQREEYGCGFQAGLISAAESEAGRTCEMCGTNQDVGQAGSWIKTICWNCANTDPERYGNWKSLAEIRREEDEDV